MFASLLLLGLIGSLIAGGCDGSSSSSSSSAPATDAQPPVRVMATVYILADLARQVGGKYADVEWAIESGQSMSGFEPTRELRERIGRAELIVAGGGSDEAWAVGEEASSLTPYRFLRLDMLRVAPLRSPADDPGSGASAATEGGTGGLRWLDPRVLSAAVDALVERFINLRPKHDVYFRSRAQRLKQELDILADGYADQFARQPRRRVLAMTYDFDALASRMGVDVTHPVIATVERLTDIQISDLRTAVRREHLPVLIVRADTPPALIADLSQRTGTRVFTLDAFGSSAADSGRATVQDLLKFNLDHLLEAAKAGQ